MSVMSDMISREAAVDSLTNTNLKRNVDSVQDGDMNRTRRAAQRVIANLPTIEAIPIEWLEQKYKENEPSEDYDKEYDRYLWDAIAYILTEWKEEQEGI